MASCKNLLSALRCLILSAYTVITLNIAPDKALFFLAEK